MTICLSLWRRGNRPCPRRNLVQGGASGRGPCYFYVPLSCPTPPPILPNFHLRKQNEACSGMPKINFNPTWSRPPTPPCMCGRQTDTNAQESGGARKQGTRLFLCLSKPFMHLHQSQRQHRRICLPSTPLSSHKISHLAKCQIRSVLCRWNFLSQHSTLPIWLLLSVFFHCLASHLTSLLLYTVCRIVTLLSH